MLKVTQQNSPESFLKYARKTDGKQDFWSNSGKKFGS
jgi:hypothetical protein